MSVTIQKTSGGAVFTIQNPGDVARPYGVNDYELVPTGDNISLSLIRKRRTGINGALAPDDVILSQPYTNVINGDTSSVFADYATYYNYILTNFFRKAGSSTGAATWGVITGTLSAQTDLQTALNGKQATLITGSNIKNLNGISLLGSGNFSIDSNLILKPDQLSGVKVWADITDLKQITATITTNKVSSILDKSGNSNHLVQATTGNQPVLLFNGGNGYPYLNFTGTQYISKTLSQALPYTVYLYVRINVNGGPVLVGFSGDYHNSILILDSTNTNVRIAAGSNFYFNDQRMSAPIGKWCLFRYSLDASGVVTGSCDHLGLMGPGYSLEGSNIAGTTAISNFMIGESDNGGSNFDMQEVILLDHVTTYDEDTKIRNYFFNKYNTVFSKSIYCFGDSITYGSNASPITNGYAYLVAANLGAKIFNYGVSGTTVGYPPVTGSVTNSLAQLYKTFDVRNKDAYITFCYGANEIPDASWAAMYQSLIQYFIDAGFDKNKICIISQLDPGTGNIGACHSYITAIASALGIRYADCSAISSSGLIDSGPHPNNAGHAAMATIIEAALA